MEDVNDQGDEDLYAKLDSAYATEDEEETEVIIYVPCIILFRFNNSIKTRNVL